MNKIEVFVKIKKKNFYFFFGGGGSVGGVGVGLGGQSGCERRIEVVKIQKKIEGGGRGVGRWGGGGVGGGVRVDVNEEL